MIIALEETDGLVWIGVKAEHLMSDERAVVLARLIKTSVPEVIKAPLACMPAYRVVLFYRSWEKPRDS